MKQKPTKESSVREDIRIACGVLVVLVGFAVLPPAPAPVYFWTTVIGIILLLLGVKMVVWEEINYLGWLKSAFARCFRR